MVAHKALKGPGKTILPRNKFQRSRRFSLVDSDSSLSEFESDDNDDNNDDNEDDNDDDELSQYNNNNKRKSIRQFQALDSDDGHDESDSSTNEELWRNHADQVVNTSSEEDEDDDGQNDDDDVSSSSDDENVDFVKLTAERKARTLQQYRSNSPFKSPSPVRQNPIHDVDFSFDFNNNDHQLRIGNENEEDLGEELTDVISPLKDHQARNQPIAPLSGFVNIADSESDDDIDKDELLKTLEQDSDGIETGLGTGEDDYNLLREEADNILQEYGRSDTGFDISSENTHRNPIVDDLIQKHKDEINPNEVLQYVSDDEYDDDDDYDDADDYLEDQFSVPFFDDTLFREKLYSEHNRLDNVNQQDKDTESDDDSYLWDYFFSSGDENEDGEQQEEVQDIYSDDEATDEDTTLPPPSSRKKIGSKAQELLSSSSVTARPPTLGTWSTDSKPFGIIDGLSTRSLLPTPSKNIKNPSDQKLPSTPATSANNVEDFTLDELLNISEFEDDNDDELHFNKQDWEDVTGSARKVPLSAFRNKGIVNPEQSHLNATRRFSISNNNGGIGATKKNPKKSKQSSNEVIMTPVRSLSKNSKLKKRSSKLKTRRQNIAEAAVEGLRATKGGLFSEDTLTNVEEFLSGLGNEAELSILFQ
ncbi:hypothetical protein WICMUC_004419 [Wickerhamomyces mucosus]|uniref:Protein IFH1 n=1 Tax=Wickerhamomyces mucosus TaxID=1378264 RepID=A0A9P8PIM7_9ASCO|nr:hypothetical protein WICMUC_004419 [Wickerhamomyces mucosus]